MKRLADTDLFYNTVRLTPGSRVNYVFIRDYEEILDPRNPRRTVTRAVGHDMEVMKNEDFEMSWTGLPGWREPEYLAATGGGPVGRLVAHTIDS